MVTRGGGGDLPLVMAVSIATVSMLCDQIETDMEGSSAVTS